MDKRSNDYEGEPAWLKMKNPIGQIKQC
jgi:hypothetical protein